MDHRPIGVFDSGLGGLTAVTAIKELLPEENIVYFGDTARMPYGTKSPPVLRKMAQQDMELIAGYGVKAMIAACGTISSIAPDVLLQFPVPVFNVVDAAVNRTVRIGGNAPLGIIATQASIKSGVFAGKIAALCPGREIIALPCQDFVRIIEEGHTDPNDPVVTECVQEALSPLRGKKISALLLGCTHFGFLSEAIRAYLGEDVRLVSASACAAEALTVYLEENALTGGSGNIRYLTSGSREQFAELSSRLLGEDTAPFTLHIDTGDIDI